MRLKKIKKIKKISKKKIKITNKKTLKIFKIIILLMMNLIYQWINQFKKILFSKNLKVKEKITGWKKLKVELFVVNIVKI